MSKWATSTYIYPTVVSEPYPQLHPKIIIIDPFSYACCWTRGSYYVSFSMPFRVLLNIQMCCCCATTATTVENNHSDQYNYYALFKVPTRQKEPRSNQSCLARAQTVWLLLSSSISPNYLGDSAIVVFSLAQ